MISDRLLDRDGQPLHSSPAPGRPIDVADQQAGEPEDVAAWVDGLFNDSPGQEARDATVMDATDCHGSSGVPAVIDVAGELVDWETSGVPFEEWPTEAQASLQVKVRAKFEAAQLKRTDAAAAWERKIRDLEKLPLDGRSRIDLRVSPEFKGWVQRFADHMGASITVAVCSSLVAQARAAGFHPSPPSRYNRVKETPDPPHPDLPGPFPMIGPAEPG